MKILLPVKRVIDANVKVRMRDETHVETTHVKMAMNPFCEVAVERAVRLREAGHAEAAIAVSIGGEKCQETLRTALAMGVDRAILVDTGPWEPEPLSVAKILQKIVERESIDLVLLGKQAIDGDNNQTGQKLAGLLNWPQATFLSELTEAGSSFEVTREVDGGLQILQITLPAVMTVDLRLNEPRYASLPNIMKARSKPIARLKPEDLEVSVASRLKVLKLEEPEVRKEGARVASAAELLEKLRHEAKVLPSV